MENSTAGVTLFAGFIFDLLAPYKGKLGAKALLKMAKDLDENEPTKLVPIQLYNDMCDWIEKNLGPANLRLVGEYVGERAYEAMQQMEKVEESATPQQILTALKEVADIVIQDPLERGWDIVEMGENRAVMRRTQTFHRILQEGRGNGHSTGIRKKYYRRR